MELHKKFGGENTSKKYKFYIPSPIRRNACPQGD